MNPVDPALIKAELNDKTLLWNSSHGGFQVYLVDGVCAPNVLREIGRLREHAYRNKGGGTGKAIDLDHFDLDQSLGFKQLVLWDPENEMIAGGYRILFGDRCRYGEDGQPLMPSSHLFRFSDRFLKDYMPATVELSRSFITASFMQNSSATRNVFALDSLLGGICKSVAHTSMKYFFGKVTFYPDYPKEALGLVSAFFKKHCADDMVFPHVAYPVDTSCDPESVFTHDNFKEDFRALKLELRKRGYYLPPILNTYINLSSDFRYFGLVVYHEFSGAIEMGLLVNFDDLQPERYRELLDN